MSSKRYLEKICIFLFNEIKYSKAIAILELNPFDIAARMKFNPILKIIRYLCKIISKAI